MSIVVDGRQRHLGYDLYGLLSLSLSISFGCCCRCFGVSLWSWFLRSVKTSGYLTNLGPPLTTGVHSRSSSGGYVLTRPVPVPTCRGWCGHSRSTRTDVWTQGPSYAVTMSIFSSSRPNPVTRSRARVVHVVGTLCSHPLPLWSSEKRGWIRLSPLTFYGVAFPMNPTSSPWLWPKIVISVGVTPSWETGGLHTPRVWFRIRKMVLGTLYNVRFRRLPRSPISTRVSLLMFYRLLETLILSISSCWIWCPLSLPPSLIFTKKIFPFYRCRFIPSYYFVLLSQYPFLGDLYSPYPFC